jgi:hypothetical protein
MHISSEFLPLSKDLELNLPETFFLTKTTCCGWGTWSRAWKYFHRRGEELINQFTQNDIYKFNVNGIYPLFQHLIDNIEGKMNTWSIYWSACVYTLNGLVLYPKYTKTIHIGYDGTGVNCTPLDLPLNFNNDHKITQLTNIFIENKYAFLIYSKLYYKFFVKPFLLRRIVKFILYNILNLDKQKIRRLATKILVIKRKITH